MLPDARLAFAEPEPDAAEPEEPAPNLGSRAAVRAAQPGEPRVWPPPALSEPPLLEPAQAEPALSEPPLSEPAQAERERPQEEPGAKPTPAKPQAAAAAQAREAGQESLLLAHSAHSARKREA